MTKKRMLMLVAIFTSGMLMSLNAQNLFSKGDKIVNVGIGIGSYYGGDGYSSSIPPISVSYERGMVDGLLDGKASIGLGGYMAYTANKWETSAASYNYGYKYSYFILGVRGVFHYQFIDNLDTYTGLMLGYNAVNSKYFGDDMGPSTPSASGTSGIGYSAFLGARYQFSDKFSAFAEIGYGISALELGISFRL